MAVKASLGAVLALIACWGGCCGPHRASNTLIADTEKALDPVCYENEADIAEIEMRFSDEPAELPEGIRCLEPPLAAAAGLTVSRQYRDPGHFRPNTHSGTDVPVPVGTEIRAPAPGKVTFSKATDRGTHLIVVDMGEGWSYSVAHLSELRVQAGEVVKVGQLIGLTGGAKNAPGSGPCTTGPHLHFAVARNGKYVDAENFLCRPFGK